MKTEFLTEILGEIAEDKRKDVIDKIMAENGKDVNAVKDAQKTAETERDNLKGQLETAQAAIKEFENMKPEELNQKIKETEDKLAAKQKELDDEKAANAEAIAKRDFDAVLDKALQGSKAKDPADVKAHLDIESLRKSQNQSADIEAAIKVVQDKKDYLFESGEPHKNPIGPTDKNPPPGDSQTAILRAAMGLPAEKKGD